MKPKKKSITRSLFHNRYLVFLFISQFCSNITANIIFFVLINLIFEKSASAVAVGILVFLYYLPTPTIGLLSGAFIDRSDRKKILVYSSLLQALTVLFFINISRQPFLAYFLIFIYSSFDEFFNPTVSTIIPSLVAKKELGTANTLWFFASQGSWLIASFTAGLLMKLLPNINYIFVFASLTLLTSAFFAKQIPNRFIKSSPPKEKSFVFQFNFLNFLEDIRRGYTFVRQKKIILFPILFLAIMQVALGTAAIIFPSLAHTLNIPFADASLLLITPTSLGALLGGLTVSKKIKEAKVRKKDLILRGIKIGGVALLIFSLINEKLKWFAPLILFVVGFHFIFAIIPVQTIIQENTPQGVRGRVYGLLGVAIALTSFLPSFFIASLIDIIGARLIILFLGGGFLFLAYTLKKHQKKIFYYLNHS